MIFNYRHVTTSLNGGTFRLTSTFFGKSPKILPDIYQQLNLHLWQWNLTLKFVEILGFLDISHLVYSISCWNFSFWFLIPHALMLSWYAWVPKIHLWKVMQLIYFRCTKKVLNWWAFCQFWSGWKLSSCLEHTKIHNSSKLFWWHWLSLLLWLKPFDTGLKYYFRSEPSSRPRLIPPKTLFLQWLIFCIVFLLFNLTCLYNCGRDFCLMLIGY